jgi:hypothetical protein
MSMQRFPSAVRSATLIGDDNAKNPGNVGCKVHLRVSAVPGVDTVQVVIEGKDSLSGLYYTILQGAVQVAAGLFVYTVYPGVAAVANVSASDVLPDTYRVRVVHSAGTAFTYSMQIVEM